MKQISKRLSYANVMSSLAVFLILGGATAIAATKIGTKQLKANAVTTGKIKKNAVTTGKIKKEAITTAKIKNEAVTGAKVNEATLGTVPSATTASNLVGQVSVSLRLSGGQSQTIATNGAVSLVAVCELNVAGNDRVRVLGQTSQNRSIIDGFDDRTGPATFLDIATGADERELTANTIATGQTNVDSEIDQGFVMGPDGKAIVANSEGIALGLNYAGSPCLVSGVLNLVG